MYMWKCIIYSWDLVYKIKERWYYLELNVIKKVYPLLLVTPIKCTQKSAGGGEGRGRWAGRGCGERSCVFIFSLFCHERVGGFFHVGSKLSSSLCSV